MTNLSAEPQMGLEEIRIDDPELTRLVVIWARKAEQKKALNKQIKALGIKDSKDAVRAKLEIDGSRPQKFRVGDYVISVSPRDALDVAFEREASVQLSLGKSAKAA